MKLQTTIGKAFEINKNKSIYGTFAEIGAGQETVNFVYKAGLASQTVAKSMSAYDMTVSDEIYGRQSRYVCKKRLLTMLNHEYRLLEKRLKRKIGNKTRFFVFATTAVTKTRKIKSHTHSQHAWMGIRFQTQTGKPTNDLIFHVNCLDKNRLQQHEALGILGINLIYACFFSKNSTTKLISLLKENLSGSRVEIQGMSASGTAFKNRSDPFLNLELLSQKLSSMAFFPSEKKSDFLSDSTFGRSLVILYGLENDTKQIQKNKLQYLKNLSLKKDKSSWILFLPTEKLTAKPSPEAILKTFCSKEFSVLSAPKLHLEELKKHLAPYSNDHLTFLISENYFREKLFNPKCYKDRFLLNALGTLFEGKTKVAIVSQNRGEECKHKLKTIPEQALKNYLVEKKQILYL